TSAGSMRSLRSGVLIRPQRIVSGAGKQTDVRAHVGTTVRAGPRAMALTAPRIRKGAGHMMTAVAERRTRRTWAHTSGLADVDTTGRDRRHADSCPDASCVECRCGSGLAAELFDRLE